MDILTSEKCCGCNHFLDIVNSSQKLILLAVIVCFFIPANAQFPNTYEFNKATEAYFDGNEDEAINWFEAELRNNPDNGYAHMFISDIRRNRSEYGRALASANHALRKIPKRDKEYSAVAYVVRASIYLGLQDSIKAEADYTNALNLNPQNKDTYKRRAQLYFEQGRYNLSNADYNKMIELNPGEVVAYTGIARNFLLQGHLEEAQFYLQRAIMLEPSYSTAYAFRGECYLKQGQYSNAIDDFIYALAYDDQSDFAYRFLMNIDKTAIPIAKAKLQVEATRNPDDFRWYAYLGELLYKNNNYREAVTFFRKSNEINTIPIVLQRIAECYYELGNYNLALNYANKALAIESDDVELLWLKGDILNEMGNSSEAITQLDRAINLMPDYAYFYYRRGWYRDEQNDSNGAIEDYTMSIALAPNYTYAYIGRGKDYARLGRNEEAIADFNKVIELDTIPGVGSCAQYAYFHLGRKQDAEDFMLRYLENVHEAKADGGNYEAACFYSLMGDSIKALGHLETALRKGFRRFTHIAVDEDLDNIRNLPQFNDLINYYKNLQEIEENEFTTAEIDTIDVLTVGEPVSVPFIRENGVTKVRCEINGLPLYFVFDTGASDVTLSLVEANFMLKNGYINNNDVIGSSRYMDANGDIIEGTVINISQLNFAGLELKNVRASIVRNQMAPLLLGQTVLSRLGRIEIDNQNQTIKVSVPGH